MPLKPAASDAAAAGWSALAQADWNGAWRCFSEAAASDGSGEVLEGLSWAAWWRADASADAVFEAREGAYRAYRAAGRTRDAARVATWIGTDSVDFRGEVAVAQGWLSRARSLLADAGPCPELGWLYVHEAEKLLFAGETGRAMELGAQAVTLGRELADVDLEMMGSATEGLALVFEGQVDQGIVRLDEAAAAALAAEFRELWSAGWCCCYLIYGCEQIRDYDRAAQWCRKIEAWSDRLQISFLSRACRAHYAGVLIWQGTWDRAESELIESAARLTEMRPPLAVEAQVRLGELRRRQGRLDEAAVLFAEAIDHPLAVLGLGEVHLDRGDFAGARERAEEYLRQGLADAATHRSAGLELLARAAAGAGDAETASQALTELEVLGEPIPTEPVRGAVAFVRGVVAAASGDPSRARIAFEDAIRHYRRSRAPFEESQARLALAGELAHQGRNADALRHVRQAAETLRRIGAARAAEQATKRAKTYAPDDAPSPLTPRERQVLGLVAEGKTNRAIAQELVLSEHTVNRHITNILTKLGAGSRSAAVAEALRKNLL